MNKEEKYSMLTQQIRSLIESESGTLDFFGCTYYRSRSCWDEEEEEEE